MEYLLLKQNPATKFDIIGAGLASETVSGLSEKGHAGGAFPRPDLHERLGRALTAVKPEVVLACYGMNDGIYQPYDEKRMDAFRKGATKLADSCKKAGARLVLVTPPVFDISRAGGWGAYKEYDSKVLGKFAEWEVKNPPPGVISTVDLHTVMAGNLAQRQKADPKFAFAGDGVHPGDLGHLLIATTILNGLGVETPAVSTDALLAQIKADPLWSLINQRRTLRSNAWLAHIGYTREKKVAPETGDIATSEKKAVELQEKADALHQRSEEIQPASR